ncbi:MAG: hypothetical protein ACR2KK_19380 [Acidimicrobiales bacterium]
MGAKAWRERWLPKSADPMENVPYVAPPGEQGQGRAVMAEPDRPSTAAVERLLAAYDKVGRRHGIPWLADRAAAGAYVRLGEREAVDVLNQQPRPAAVWPPAGGGPRWR